MSNNTKKRIVNSVGIIGYLFLLVEWLWVFIIVGYPLFSSDFSFVLPPQPIQEAPQTQSLGQLQPIATFVAIATSLLVLAMTVITVVQLPKTIAKQGKKTTSRITKQIIPHVVPKKEQTNKRVLVLSTRLTYALKCSAIIVPVVVLILSPNTTPLAKDLTIIVASFFCLITAGAFSLQACLAYALHLPHKYVW